MTNKKHRKNCPFFQPWVIKRILWVLSALLIIGGVFAVRFMNRPNPSSPIKEKIVYQDTIEFATIPLDSIFEREDRSIEFRLMCEQDLWLKTQGLNINTPLLKDLVDMYNAATAIRSIFTDFDLAMRNQVFSKEAKAAIKVFDLSVITDQETKDALKKYQQQMLALFDQKPNAVNQEEINPYRYRDEADAFVSDKYLITHYCDTEIETLATQLNDIYWNNPNVPDWDTLRSRQGDITLEPELQFRYSQSRITDEQCIYLIELSHIHVAKYDDQSPYPGLMYEMLTSGQYSKYLYGVWIHWRCMCQQELGSSRDSYIPNWIFNQVRNQCAYATLAYIVQHPSDMMAVNVFMQLSSEQNIYREGTYPYGNQNMMDFYCLFHEQFENEEENQ